MRSVLVYILLVITVCIYQTHVRGVRHNSTISPSYCIDPIVEKIFSNRVTSCLEGKSVLDELNDLRLYSVSEYQRAHELIAYQYFLEKSNPHRRDCSNAHFEYVPFIVLPWKIGVSSMTGCTAFGNCAQSTVRNRDCRIEAVVKSIIDYVGYVKTKRSTSMRNGKPRFVVSSVYNLKTILGRGMPVQFRHGDAYNTVTEFIENTFIGHYERIPQCADLLRKQWKRLIELPYIPLLPSPPSSRTTSIGHDSVTFLFSGRLVLWGSERVCSVRATIAQHMSLRDDAVVFNISEPHTMGRRIVDPVLVAALSRSTFCIVSKADSYSTAAFYNAIMHDCIPVVISDWYVFSFWWLIPYTEFVIRIKEEVFLSNPDAALDHVKETFGQTDIVNMRAAMQKWKKFFSFGISGVGIAAVVPPLDTMLIEMHYALLEMSTSHKQPVYGSSDEPDVMAISYTDRIRSEYGHKLDEVCVYCRDPVACTHVVQPLVMPQFKDVRSHICQHAPRLIGHYKIVFFMQCVRMLWPLKPGKLKPVDISGLTAEDRAFIYEFHNISKSDSSMSTFEFKEWDVYPPVSTESKHRIFTL